MKHGIELIKHRAMSRVAVLAVVASPAAAFAQVPADPTKSGAEITISVAEAVRSALEYHPDVVKPNIEVEIAEIEISRQRGLFQPSFTATGLYRREGVYVDDPAATVDGVNKRETGSVESAVGGRAPWGGQYSFGFRGARIANEPGSSRLSPQYQTQLSGRYTQPLLRDFGMTANWGLVDRAELQRELARAQLREEREKLALEVVAGYWTLVVRREELRIREGSVSEAVNLRELVERRIRGGQAPKSDLVQSDVTVAERQQQVGAARLEVVAAERDLLAATYLNRSGKFGWASVLVPAETPSKQPVTPQFEQELEVALRNRPEVRRLERAVEVARLNYAIAENARRIKLDVYAEAGLLGAAGRSTLPAGDPMAAPPLLHGGFDKSINNSVSAKAPFIEVGVQIEIPIGNSDRAGAAEQAKLRINSVLAEDVRTAVALDVRAAMQSLAISHTRMLGAANAEKLAVLNVDAQKKRYEGGAATLFDVIRAQDELARAKGEVVLAAAEQEVALVRVVAARGTLLEHFGIGK